VEAPAKLNLAAVRSLDPAQGVESGMGAVVGSPSPLSPGQTAARHIGRGKRKLGALQHRWDVPRRQAHQLFRDT